MFDLQRQISAIEGQARLNRIPIRDFCKSAGVAVSNWSRWKSGTSSPTFSKWKKVETYAAQIFPDLSAASTPSPDGTAGHAAGSCGGPKSRTLESPSLADGVDRAAPAEASG
jgi:hypothetical protein